MAASPEKSKHISVTHFINPQLFWYHEISVPNDAYREIKDLEEQLEQYYKTHQPWSQAVRKPAIGMLVAVKFLAWHKMIRARVEHIANFSRSAHGGEFIMWAIDYGFPFQTKSEQIFRLPDKLSHIVDHIQKGGLADLWPAEKDFDFRQNCAMTSRKEQWSQRACELVDKLLNESESVVFIENFQTQHHAWGDLIVTTHLGDKCNIRDYLIGMSLALDAGPLFRETCAQLKVIKILPWMTNSGNSKYSSNKGFICAGNGERDEKKMQNLFDVECNDYAKKKVEDWCARNELQTFRDSEDFDTDMLIDGISFDDSVSNKNFEIQKPQIVVDGEMDEKKEIAKDKRHKQREITQKSQKQQQKSDLLEKVFYDDPVFANSTPSEVIHDQQMGLAGALSQSRSKKYANKDVPPQPREIDFDVSADSERSLSLTPNKDEKEKLLSGVESLASMETGLSARKLRLLEKRKQLGTKNTGEQCENNKQQQQQPLIDVNSYDLDIEKQMQNTVLEDKASVTSSVANSRVRRHLLKRQEAAAMGNKKTTEDKNIINNESCSLPMKQLCETKEQQQPLIDLNCSELDIEKKMRNTALEDNASGECLGGYNNNNNNASVSTSVANSRVRRHLLSRHKVAQVQREESSTDSASTSTNDLVKAQVSASTKRKQKLEAIKARNAEIAKVEKAKAESAKILDNEGAKKSAEHAQKPTSARMGRLINLRKKVNDVMSESFSEQTNLKFSPLSPPTETLNEKCTFYGMRMVPAGFDLTNLNRYNNEKNHWHRKATTRYDYVPHSEDMLAESSSRDTLNALSSASSSSESKELVDSPLAKSVAKHTSILDTTVPEIDTEPIDLFSAAEREIMNKSIKRAEEQQLARLNSPAPPKRYGRYRSLKSPSAQMNKIDEILRSALDEKACGNDDILDLKNLNSSVCKEDSDNTELFSAEDGTCGGNTTDNEENTIDSDKHSSNKRSLIRCRLQKQLQAKQTQLKLKEAELTSELNDKFDNKPESYRIHLPLVQDMREVEGEHRLKTKFIDHLVLAHSKVQLSSIAQTSEAFFLKEIQDEMENMRVTKLYRIQAYAWPHLLRSNSLYVVNPNKSGKTWSYLPAICSLVAYRIQICGLTDTYGPVAIIMVPTSAHVEIVQNYCKRLLLGVRPAVTTIGSFGVRNANDAKIQLLNSCGILVATPGSLLRILQDNEKESLIDLARLRHLIIDDLDLMLSRAQDDVKTILKTFFKLSKQYAASKNSAAPSDCEALPWQLVVTSRDWDSLLVALMRKSNEPLLLIGDFLEAAVYGRVMISIKLCPSERKAATIIEFIEQNSLENERLLVLCNSDDDVFEVVDALTTSGYVCIGYDSNATSDVRIIIDEWRKKKLLTSRILVCADASFPELQIQNVSHIIHYSMPTSWTKFTTRFSALAQTYENHVSRNFDMTTSVGVNRPNTRALILLDEENSIQLPRLMDFMKKHDQLKLIHADILAVSKRVLLEREESRILQGARMCPFVLEFGECDEPRCEFRHNLTRFDAVSKEDNIPIAGDMRILILKVFSPTHYAARLLEHRAPNCSTWHDIRRSKEVCNFSMQMNLHYMNRENWTIHWPFQLGDMCVYKYCDTYQRVRILELPEVQNKDLVRTLRVSVKLIDEGSIISGVKSDELYVCHNDFKDFPAQAINIRLSGVVPFDNERTWDSKATKTVQKWIMADITKKECVHVSINFTLIDTIWVNNVIVMEQLDQLGQYVYRVNLKRSLLEKDIGAAADNKRQSIREIAEEFGLLAAHEAADATISDSEMEFKTCSENDISNLMKFSSNDETMDSEKLMKGERGDKQALNKSGELIKINGSHQVVRKKRGDEDDEEEDWDANDDRDPNEIYLPLRATYEIEVNAEGTTGTAETTTTTPTNAAGKMTTPKTPKTKTTTKAAAAVAVAATPTTPKQIAESEESAAFAAASPVRPTDKEAWLTLPLEEIVKVEIGDEAQNGNWNDIYLQNIDDEYLNKFDELLELINDHIARLRRRPIMPLPASWFKPMQNCIVHYDKRYLRAKLYGIFSTDPAKGATRNSSIYRFFLCDYACFVMAKPEDLYNDFLYPTTQEIVEFAPYQAVHCTLAGIKLDRFAITYKLTKDYLFAYAVKERAAAAPGAPDFQIKSYEILLYENEYENDLQTLELFNKTLVLNGIAAADEKTEHYLDVAIKLPQVSKDLCNFDELLQCIQRSFQMEMDETAEGANKDTVTPLQAIEPPPQPWDTPKKVEQKLQKADNACNAKGGKRLYKPLKSKSKSHPHSTSGSEEEPLLSSVTTVQTSTSSSSDNDRSFSSTSAAHDTTSSSSTDALPPPPQLQAKYKRPQVSWYDTDCFVYLVINAPDISDYDLQVTEDTLIFYAEINQQPHALILNFAGLIEPELVSHEIRGLNVVVRLVKGVYMKWPRLLKQTARYPWLTFNLNAADLTDLEKLLPQQQLEMILQKTMGYKLSGSSSDDDDYDDEQNLFQTFTPIFNSEDMLDPTVEIF